MKKNVLECMSVIVEQFSDKKATMAQILEGCPDEVKTICSVLKLSETQALILSVLIECADHSNIDARDIAKEMNLKYTRFLSYESEMQGLIDMGLVQLRGRGEYVVAEEAMDAIKDNTAFIKPNFSGVSEEKIFERITDIISDRISGYVTEDDTLSQIHELGDSNKQSPFFTAVRDLGIQHCPKPEELLFYYLVHSYIEGEDEIRWFFVDSVFERHFTRRRLEQGFKFGSLRLQKFEVIEPCCEDGIKSPETFHIVDSVKDKLFVEMGGSKNANASLVELLSSSKLPAKKLYFNAKEDEQLSRLRSLLEPVNYDSICARLQEKGQRKGFSCIFYGSPGTGKTESVYQLAKQTGRDIFPVDVPELRSCWVGESEKQVKALFVRYRRAVESSERAPILLFNEADAIFGARMEGAKHSVDKMENTMQNIILQEMETLDGILIATTNLACNLDPAFERRFLFKVRFDKPEVEVKAKIWRSMIPSLTVAQSKQLATDFDFSGGQIENISRKKDVQEIITGDKVDFAQIRRFCSEECLTDTAPTTRKRIGF